MDFTGFDITKFKLTPRKRNEKLPAEDVKAMLWLYSETTAPVTMIFKSINVDRRTMYRYIHANGIELRRPGYGNTSNHPTKFDKELREAYEKYLAEGGCS